VEVPAGFQRLYVVRDRCDSGIHRRQAEWFKAPVLKYTFERIA
jgi:hypothetical protein